MPHSHNNLSVKIAENWEGNGGEEKHFTHGSLFSGIGGFDLAAEWMGWENKFHCEWNEFGQKVLKYYWPNAELFTDITKSDFTKYANRIDILTGGFPCQPYSVAGKRKGKEDNRHLWPEMLRAIREIQPSWVVGENVSGIVSWNRGLVFHEVQTDLENEGYKVLPFILPACSVNAPHRRDRVWFIAYSDSNRNNRAKGTEGNIWEQHNKEQTRSGGTMQVDGFSNEQDAANTNSNGCDRGNSKHEKYTSEGRFNALNDTKPITTSYTNNGSGQKHKLRTRGNLPKERADTTRAVSNSECERLERRRREWQRLDTRHKRGNWSDFPTESPICVRNDGIPTQLDGITFPKWRNESIKAAGNAIVPQVVFEIFKVIEKMSQ